MSSSMPAPTAAQAARVGTVVDNGTIKLLDIIGRGGFGVVHRAVYVDSFAASGGKEFAVKIVQLSKDAAIRRRQENEVKMNGLVYGHPNVMPMHHYFFDGPDHLCLVMDLASGGDLLTAVARKAVFFKDERRTRSAIFQLLDAVEWCHENGVSHHDIKLENVLLSEDGETLLLSDLGLADSRDVCTTFGIGTPGYQAPEQLNVGYPRRTSYSGKASDIWALGVVMINMLVGCNMWEDALESDYYYSVYKASPKSFGAHLPVPPAVAKLFQRIFDLNPDTRITVPALRTEVGKIDHFFPNQRELRKMTTEARELYDENAAVRSKAFPEVCEPAPVKTARKWGICKKLFISPRPSPPRESPCTTDGGHELDEPSASYVEDVRNMERPKLCPHRRDADEAHLSVSSSGLSAPPVSATSSWRSFKSFRRPAFMGRIWSPSPLAATPALSRSDSHSSDGSGSSLPYAPATPTASLSFRSVALKSAEVLSLAPVRPVFAKAYDSAAAAVRGVVAKVHVRHGRGSE